MCCCCISSVDPIVWSGIFAVHASSIRLRISSRIVDLGAFKYSNICFSKPDNDNGI